MLSPHESIKLLHTLPSCGLLASMIISGAAARESAGLGETDAFAASEMPTGRGYDRVLAITRSGTTTEVLQLLRELEDTPTVTLTGVPGTAVDQVSSHTVVLEFADEESVVQTRFATTALAFLRGNLGADLEAMAQDCERALDVDLAPLPQGRPSHLPRSGRRGWVGPRSGA